MKLFRDDIVHEKDNVNIKHNNDDKNNDVGIKEDIGESQERVGDEVVSKWDQAPPIEDEHDTTSREVCNVVSKKRKGQGLSKRRSNKKPQIIKMCKECGASQPSASMITPQKLKDIESKIANNIMEMFEIKLKPILEQMILPKIDFTNASLSDQLSQTDPKIPIDRVTDRSISKPMKSIIPKPTPFSELMILHKTKEGRKGSNTEEESVLQEPNNKRKVLLLNDEVHKYLTSDCKWLHICATNMCEPIEVELLKDQFNFIEDASIYLDKEDVCQFLLGEVLNTSMMHAFMSASYEYFNGNEYDIVGWLCPKTISASKCLEQPTDVKEYIHHSLKKSIEVGHKFILAPYFQNTHWILLIILPLTNTIYEFDSLGQHLPCFSLLKSMLNSTMKKLHESMTTTSTATFPEWKSLKGLLQGSCSESGYTVIRLMYDIKSSVMEIGDDEVGKVLNSLKEDLYFTKGQIEQMKDFIAQFLSCRCMW